MVGQYAPSECLGAKIFQRLASFSRSVRKQSGKQVFCSRVVVFHISLLLDGISLFARASAAMIVIIRCVCPRNVLAEVFLFPARTASTFSPVAPSASFRRLQSPGQTRFAT